MLSDKQQAEGWLYHKTRIRPVGEYDQVRVMFRDGCQSSKPLPAFYWDKLWRQEGMHRSNDIIAYKPESHP